MSILVTMTDVSDAISEPFSSEDQPYYILVSGDFVPDGIMRTRGAVRVECQMSNGEWVRMSGMTYNQYAQDNFKLPPRVQARVSVSGCESVSVEVHSDLAPGD